jgi:hypothetical protein
MELLIATNDPSFASIHPAIPRDLIRRQEPLVSPSCTREFGPTEATMCELRSAPARTVTHSRAIMLTHGEAVRRSRP